MTLKILRVVRMKLIIVTSIVFVVIRHDVAAHDFFLVPSAFRLQQGDSVKIQIHVSEYFPGESVKWNALGVLRFDQYRNVRRKHFVATLIDNLLDFQLAPDSSGVPLFLDEAGTYMFVLNWKARLIELEPKLFHQYLNAEGLDRVLKTREERGDAQKPGRERYSRFVKTFVQVGEGMVEGWNEVAGQKIEIVPESNPSAAEVGDTLNVQVLYEGLPLHGALVSATYAGYTTKPDTYAQSVRTDTDGGARFVLTHAGPWLVRVVHMVPLEGDREADWESFWASMTFFVQN